jgi:chromosome segregation ATPase
MSTVTRETLKQKGEELQSKLKEVRDSLKEFGIAVAQYAQDQAETRLTGAREFVRSLESQGENLLKSRLSQRLPQVSSWNDRILSQTTEVLGKVRPEVEKRFQALLPVLDGVEKGIKNLGERVKELLKNAQSWAERSNSLPIPGYDEKSAPEIIQALKGLNPKELEAVKAYEASHKNRKTILKEIDTLLGGSPETSSATPQG